jgi:hypothetical protein
MGGGRGGAAMTAATPSAPDLPRLTPANAVVWKWLLRAGSVALLVLVAAKVLRTNPDDLRKALPDSLWFWPTLMALYFTLPAADWLIFRRLWRLPLAGLPVLMGKRISNELLLAYSGEAYFYLWARRRTGLTAAPFGAIRDVNILSALAGNGLTLALVLAFAPHFDQLNLSQYSRAIILSAAAVTAVPLALTLLSRRLFVLSPGQSAWVVAVHLARLAASYMLLTQLWRLSLPDAPLSLWIALATVRLFIGRLPLALNPEMLFAAVAGALVGDATEIAAVISLTSVAMLILHLIVASGLMLWSFVGGDREQNAADTSGPREDR